jgi:hypothetical protein
MVTNKKTNNNAQDKRVCKREIRDKEMTIMNKCAGNKKKDRIQVRDNTVTPCPALFQGRVR